MGHGLRCAEPPSPPSPLVTLLMAFSLSQNTRALLSLQLCHLIISQTKRREIDFSLKILSVSRYDGV